MIYKTPKNYSRKVFICSCECFIVDKKTEKTIDTAMVKYKVKPLNRRTVEVFDKKKYWMTPSYWGEFEDVTEFPKIISKLNKEEFEVKIGHFMRDKLEMPFVHSIEVEDGDKYLKLKNQELRKEKIKKLRN